MIRVSKLSTQKVTEEGIVLRGRTEEDIYHLVHYVLIGRTYNPLVAGYRGFCSMTGEPMDIANEIINTQILYNKMKGLRVRGFIVTIPTEDLGSGDFIEHLNHIAYDISGYFLFKGFQCVYGAFANFSDDTIDIWYIINTVSYEDGSKYQAGDQGLSELYYCAQSVVNRVTGVIDPNISFRFSSLEYYPYSNEIN